MRRFEFVGGESAKFWEVGYRDAEAKSTPTHFLPIPVQSPGSSHGGPEGFSATGSGGPVMPARRR